MKYLIKSTLLLLTILFSATAWGQTTITFIPGETVGNNETAQGADSMEKDGITISTTNGGLKAAQYRFSKGSVTTVASTIGNITKIEFTCSANGTEKYGPGCFAAQSGYSYEGNVGTWVGSAASVEFTAETNQVRATNITLTIDDNSLAIPIIKPANGAYCNPIEVTMTCATTGAEIYYTTNGDDPTTSSTKYTTPFTLNTSTTVKAISAKDDKTSDVISTEYVIVDGVALCELSDIKDNTQMVIKNDAIVLGQMGSYLYLKDIECGYGIARGNCGQAYQPGDVIPAGYGGIKVTYNMEPELKGPLTGFQPKKNNIGGLAALEAAAEVITISQVGHDTWGHYVRIDNVAINTAENTFSDATGTIGYYDRFIIDWSYDPSKTYTIYAIVGSYTTNYELLPTRIEIKETAETKFEVDGIWYRVFSEETIHVISHQDNYYSGVVVIPNTVTYQNKTYTVTGIDADAFYYCTNLKGLSIPVTIENINHNAFYGCYNLEWIHIYGAGAWSAGEINASYSTLYIGKEVASLSGLRAYPSAIYSYATTPPVCDENTFMDYSATLHVPATSLAAYFTAPHWCNFANIVGDAVEPDMVTIGNDSIETTVNSQFTLTASATPVNSTPNAITWKSSNTNVAIVNEGIVTAVGIGECDIFAQCLDKQAICHVTIKEPIITIYLDQEEASVLPNHIIVLEPSSSSDILPELSVTSSDPTIAAARVMNGKIQVVGIKEGTATITVGSADGTAVPATCLVTVYTEPGDVNMDGFLDVSDVTALISHVLGGHVENFKAENADLNGDGVYDVSDVTSLIALVLNNNG